MPRLIAIKLRDPEACASEVAKAWSDGDAVLPLDPLAPSPLIAAQIARFGPDLLVSEAGAWPLPKPLPTLPDTAAVLLTSGTTGQAKAVELSRSALTESARLVHRRLGAGPGDRWVCALPLHHVAGFAILARSRALDTRPEFVDGGDPAALASAEGNLISLVPTQLLRCLDAGVDLAGFKAVLLGGAASSPQLLARAQEMGVNVVRTYGMTETGGGVVYDGVPLDGVEVRIGDAVLPGATDRDPGDISLRTPTSMTAYRGDEPSHDEWFATDDIGRIVGGHLQVLGRTDDVINSGGEKVLPREIEDALMACPGVREAHVFGAPDEEWGQRVVAVVVGGEGARREIFDSLRTRLARHQVPKELLFLEEIPRTPNGKVDTQALRVKLRDAL